MSTSDDQLTNKWQQTRDGSWYIYGRDTEITLEEMPEDCEVGFWMAKLITNIHELEQDPGTGWPRYYFDLDRAKAECEAWLAQRESLA